MDATRDWDAYFTRVFEYTFEEVERLSDEFGESLQEWCEQFFYYLPSTWREELHQFVRWWADVGIIIQPQSIEAIEQIFESRINLTGPFALDEGQLGDGKRAARGLPIVVNVVPSVTGQADTAKNHSVTPGEAAAGALLAGVLRNAGDRAANAVKSRVPRTGGTWIQGQPGNGFWKPDTPIKLPDGTKIDAVPFRDGLPVFDEWSKGHVTIAMTGDNPFDQAQARKVWTKTNGKLSPGYGFHHDGRFTKVLTEKGETVFVGRMQVVPEILNKDVPHIGSASAARVVRAGRKLATKLNELAIKGKGPLVKVAKGFTKVATKLAKKAGRIIPFVGTALVIIDFAETAEAHGVGGAIIRALPGVGSVVTAHDVGSDASEAIRSNASSALEESYRAVNDPVEKAHREAAEETANALEEVNQRLKDIKSDLQPDEVVEAIKEPVNEFYATMHSAYSRLFRGMNLPYPADAQVDPATTEGPFKMRLRLAKEKLEREIRECSWDRSRRNNQASRRVPECKTSKRELCSILESAMSLMLPFLDCLQDRVEPGAEDGVQAIEEEFGIKLPSDFVQFLLQYNCGYAKHQVGFRVRQPGPFVDHVTLNESYGIASDDDLLDLKHNFRTYLDRVPDGFVPVADCNADQICIATSPHEYGKVYHWDHIDEGANDNTYLVADSFSEFLLCLYREPEENEERLSLFQAVERGESGFVREYLASQGDAECRNEHGHTLLMCAIRATWPKIVRLLLEHGADPNAADTQGGRPLFYAINNYSSDSAKLILAAGADPRSCDSSGSTAIEIAKHKSAYDIAKILGNLAHGNDASDSLGRALLNIQSRPEACRQFDLALAERAYFPTALKIAAFQIQGGGILDCAIECCLIGQFDNLKKLFMKAQSFLRASIEYEETPPLYRRGETEFQRLTQYALCNWLYDKRHDLRSLKAAVKAKEAWFSEEGHSDPTEVQLALPHYLDAGEYAAAIHRFEPTKIEIPNDLRNICGQGTMSYIIARHRLGQEFDADQVQTSLHAFLRCRIPEMHEHADYQHIALWMKLAFWRPGDDPIASLLKCFDYLPGLDRPQYSPPNRR